MVGGTHLYGGFNLSPYLALKVFEAVKELTSQNLDVSLSHVDDDTCEICRQSKIKSDKSLEIARDKETGHDAAPPGRSGREWAA